jgi:hypothetical protein
LKEKVEYKSTDNIQLWIKFKKPDIIFTTVPEEEAIRGHRSAHSFPTGPVIAEPFISPLGFTMTPALSKNLVY